MVVQSGDEQEETLLKLNLHSEAKYKHQLSQRELQMDESEE